MIRRTIEVSTRGIGLSVELEQLVIRKDGEELQRAPIEDIGVLVVASTAVNYSHAVITHLLKAGAVIVACDDHFLPCGLLLPQDNALQTERLAAQVRMSKPLAKRLWKQIVRTKIANQADMLPECPDAQAALRALIPEVRSGDPENVESQAARKYWPAFLGADFHRERLGHPPNNFLNYGYAILRSAVARSLAAAGLHPSLGLQHHNRGNPFCLADDLMEPLRPLVDRRARTAFRSGGKEIDKESRQELLGVLTDTVTVLDAAGPLMVALEHLTASLVRCLEGQARKLEIPRLWISADTDSCGSS